MSYVIAAPDLIAAAAADVAGIESSLKAANTAAATPTAAVIAAAQDEVSAAVASLFSGHGQAFQAASAKAVEFHSQFVSVLRGGAGAYLRSEAANASTLTSLTHATGSGSAANGDVTLYGGIYGEGVYADGRVIVFPRAQIVVDRQSSLTVAPGGMVIVGGVLPQGKMGLIDVGGPGSMYVGPHSLVTVHAGELSVSNGRLTVGPDALLSLDHNAHFYVRTMTIDHSLVNLGPQTYVGLYVSSPVTISEGILTGSTYTISSNGSPIRPSFTIVKFP